MLSLHEILRLVAQLVLRSISLILLHQELVKDLFELYDLVLYCLLRLILGSFFILRQQIGFDT